MTTPESERGPEAGGSARRAAPAHRMAEEIGSLGGALRRTSDNLREEDHRMVAGLAERAARGAERAAEYLRDMEVGGLKRDIEDLARRSPGWVMSGAFALGLLGARLLKSSRGSSPAGGPRPRRPGEPRPVELRPEGEGGVDAGA